MKVRYLHPALAAMLAMVMMFAGSAVFAQDQAAPNPEASKGNIASIYVIWPKQGQSRQFEQALKEHAVWRKSAGDTFKWSIFDPVIGSDLSSYVIRSGEHTWKEIDAAQNWNQQHGSREFNDKVGPYVDRVEHYFAETDAKHSHWTDSKDYKYFGVDSYQFKHGTRAEVNDVLDKVQKAVVDEKWPQSYEIAQVIGGDGGTTIVSPMKSLAEMADPDPSLMQILAKSLGSKDAAQAAMKQFGGAIESDNYKIYAYRPDLSTPQ